MNNALAVIERPLDQAIQGKYINMEKHMMQNFPLQKEFSEKLKEYMELSNQYYGRYVNISLHKIEKDKHHGINKCKNTKTITTQASRKTSKSRGTNCMESTRRKTY